MSNDKTREGGTGAYIYASVYELLQSLKSSVVVEYNICGYKPPPSCDAIAHIKYCLINKCSCICTAWTCLDVNGDKQYVYFYMDTCNKSILPLF